MASARLMNSASETLGTASMSGSIARASSSVRFSSTKATTSFSLSRSAIISFMFTTSRPKEPIIIRQAMVIVTVAKLISPWLKMPVKPDLIR